MSPQKINETQNKAAKEVKGDQKASMQTKTVTK